MRITNITAMPKYLCYASRGRDGKQLKSGETSIDLPFDKLTDPNLWRDHDYGIIAIRLSEADKAFIARINAADQRPIEVAKLGNNPPARYKLEKSVKNPAALEKDGETSKEPAKVPSPVNPPGTPPGQPYIPPVAPRKTTAPGLDDLKSANAELARRKRITDNGTPAPKT